MVSVQHSSPGRMVRVALLLVTEPDRESTIHCTVVPLFTGIAGTVRADCTVPDDGGVEVILALVASTIHPMVIPLPAQLNRAFSPTSALTDSGPSVSAIENKTRCKQETRQFFTTYVLAALAVLMASTMVIASFRYTDNIVNRLAFSYYLQASSQCMQAYDHVHTHR